MKKILLIIVACILYCKQMHGQTSLNFVTKQRLDSSISYSAGYKVKVEFVYDSTNSICTQLLVSEWNSSEVLIENLKEEFIYGLNGKLSETKNYDGLSNWKLYHKEVYTYNSNGNVLTTLGYNWDGIQYGLNNKNEYSYNSNNDLKQYFKYMWDNANSQWLVYEKCDYNIDSYNNITKMFTYTWDKATTSWIDNSQAEYIYDNTYPSNELINPKMYNDMLILQHKITGLFNGSIWDESTNQWIPINCMYYYSDQNVKTVSNLLLKDKIIIFPNPTSTFFSVNSNDVATVLVYSINGTLVINTNVNSEEQITTEGLSSGLYIVKIITNGKIEVKSLIVK